MLYGRQMLLRSFRHIFRSPFMRVGYLWRGSVSSGVLVSDLQPRETDVTKKRNEHILNALILFTAEPAPKTGERNHSEFFRQYALCVWVHVDIIMPHGFLHHPACSLATRRPAHRQDRAKDGLRSRPLAYSTGGSCSLFFLLRTASVMTKRTSSARPSCIVKLVQKQSIRNN